MTLTSVCHVMLRLGAAAKRDRLVLDQFQREERGARVGSLRRRPITLTHGPVMVALYLVTNHRRHQAYEATARHPWPIAELRRATGLTLAVSKVTVLRNCREELPVPLSVPAEANIRHTLSALATSSGSNGPSQC